MNAWNQSPLVRLIVPFLMGIIAAVYFPFQFEHALHSVALLFVIASAIVLIPKLNISFRKSHWFGFLINALFFLFAYQLTIYKTENFSADHFSKLNNSSHLVYARLADPYIEKDRSLKVVLQIMAVNEGEKWKSCCGKAMVYFKKDEQSLKLKYGDELLLKADFKDIPEPQNPGEFNYKRFLSFHNVFHQAYIKVGEWQRTGINSSNPILTYSINLRNDLLNVLTINHLTGDEFSVGAALLLGYCDRLDAEIITAYSSTGALHVLSVSGLHVAIVYIVFSWLLFFLDKIKNGYIIKAILLILFLWFYAALTGLSPSVLRAATMFSFIIIAKAFNKHTNIYNTLAASALFLLLFNPYLVMDVGFQLSYIAVIGIVYLQPKIHAWFDPENKLIGQVWSITSVSIAAQIATFPIGLHYFYQFPNYFLLSNLVVIPISTVIIYLGIAVFSFSKIPLFAKYLAIAFSWSIWLLNASVKWIETLPHALIQGISISTFEVILMYGMIILFIYYFTKQKFNYLIGALSVLIILLCSQVIEQYGEFQQKKLIVYNIQKASVIDFISAKSNILLTDSSYVTNESGLQFHVKHNWWDLGIDQTKVTAENIKTAQLNIHDGYVQFYNKRIFIANKKQDDQHKKIANPLQLDYLIVSDNSIRSISDVLKNYTVKTIVFDSSNSEYKINKWKQECLAFNQSYYSVGDSGALVVDL